MLVVLSVVMALLGTGVAHHFARLELGTCGGRIEFGLACEYAAGSLAHVRAVKTEPDASAHLGDVVLGKVGIGAGRAGLSAGHACLDAFDEQLAVKGAWPTMGLKQRRGLGHDSFPSIVLSSGTFTP
jgi:hypothetical protein